MPKRKKTPRSFESLSEDGEQTVEHPSQLMGKGEEPLARRSELKLIEQAARWPVEADYRKAAVNRVVRIIANDKTDKDGKAIVSGRLLMAAVRALIAMERQNQVDDVGQQPPVPAIAIQNNVTIQRELTTDQEEAFFRAAMTGLPEGFSG